MEDGDPLKSKLSAYLIELRMLQQFPEGKKRQSTLNVILLELEELGVSFSRQAQSEMSSIVSEAKGIPIGAVRPAKVKTTIRKANTFFIENGQLSKKPSMHSSAVIYLESIPQPKRAHMNGTIKIDASVSISSTESATPKSRLEMISDPFSQGLKIVREYSQYLDEILIGIDEVRESIKKLEQRLCGLEKGLKEAGKDKGECDFLTEKIRNLNTEIKRLKRSETLIELVNARREKLRELKFLFEIGRAREITPTGYDRLIFEINNFCPINQSKLLQAMKDSGLAQYKDDPYISKNSRRAKNCCNEAVKRMTSYELKLKDLLPAIRCAAKLEMVQFMAGMELEWSQDEPYVYNKSEKEFIADIADIVQHYIQDLDYLSEIIAKPIGKHLTVQEEKFKNILKMQRSNLVKLQEKCQHLKDGKMSLEKEIKEFSENVKDITMWDDIGILLQKMAQSEDMKDVSTCTRLCVAAQYVKAHHVKLNGICDVIEDELTSVSVDEAEKLKTEMCAEKKKDAVKTSDFFEIEKVKCMEKGGTMSRLTRSLIS